MNSTRTTLIFVLVFMTLSLLSGCASHPYLKASGDFATAVSAAAPTLQSMKPLNSQLCLESARFDYLFHRIEASNKVFWAEYFTHTSITNYPDKATATDPSWQMHCEELQKADGLVNKAVGGLSAYASALKAVAGEDYSGADVKTLVNDADTLANSMTSSTKATSVAKTLTDPLATLAGVLEQNYAEKKVAEIVKAADPSVTAILDGIDKYIQALIEEGNNEVTRANIALNAADSSLGKDGLEILQFFQIAATWTDDLQAKIDTQQALAGVVKKLQAAEAALAKAGSQENPDKAPELKTVLGNALTVITDIQALNSAIQGKGGNSK